MKQQAELKNYVENKWGFLKNIININSFFSTDEAQDQTLPETKEEEAVIKEDKKHPTVVPEKKSELKIDKSKQEPKPKEEKEKKDERTAAQIKFDQKHMDPDNSF